MSECAWSDHTAIQAHCIHLNPWVQNQAVYPHWGCLFIQNTVVSSVLES